MSNSEGWLARTSRSALVRVILLLLAAVAIGTAIVYARKADAAREDYIAARDSLAELRPLLDAATGAVVELTDRVERVLDSVPEAEIVYTTLTRTIRLSALPGEPAEALEVIEDTTATIVIEGEPYPVPLAVARFGESCLALKAACALLVDSINLALLPALAAYVDQVDETTDAADKALDAKGIRIPLLGFISWSALAPGINLGVGAGLPILGCSGTEESSTSIVNDIPTTTNTITECPDVVGVIYLGIGWRFSI